MIKKYTLAPLMAALLISTTPVVQAGWFGDMWKKTKSTFTANPGFIPLALIGTVFAVKYAGYTPENLPSLVSAIKSVPLPSMEFPGSHIAKLACKATIASAIGLGTAVKTSRTINNMYRKSGPHPIATAHYRAAKALLGDDTRDGVILYNGMIGGATGAAAGIATYKALNHYL